MREKGCECVYVDVCSHADPIVILRVNWSHVLTSYVHVCACVRACVCACVCVCVCVRACIW